MIKTVQIARDMIRELRTLGLHDAQPACYEKARQHAAGTLVCTVVKALVGSQYPQGRHLNAGRSHMSSDNFSGTEVKCPAELCLNLGFIRKINIILNLR